MPQFSQTPLPENFHALDLVDEISRHHLDQDSLTHHILMRLTQVVPAKGPCSFIRLNRFMSVRDKYRKPGKIFDTFHINAPPRAIVKAWLVASNAAGNPIEKALYRKYQNNLKYGSTSYAELFPSDPTERLKWWNRTIAGHELYSLAQKRAVAGLAYLWVQCAEDDLWIFSLRRKRKEKPFTRQDVATLYEFAQALHENMERWYFRTLRELTPMERRVVGSMSRENFKVENAAKLLRMSTRTYETHQLNLYKEFKVNSRASLLKHLRETSHCDSHSKLEE